MEASLHGVTGVADDPMPVPRGHASESFWLYSSTVQYAIFHFCSDLLAGPLRLRPYDTRSTNQREACCPYVWRIVI